MKKITTLLVLCGLALATWAQQLPTDNQFVINTFSLNPAFAGEHGNIEAFLGHRSSWMGIDGAPRLSQVSLNAALRGTMGLGVTVKSESVGNFEHFYGALAYAYHLKLSDEMYLSLGLEGMFYRNQIDNSRIISKGLDPLLENVSALQGTTYDAGAGLGVWVKNFTFGASAQRLMGAQINYGGDEQQFFYKTNLQINAYLAYMFAFGKSGGSRKKGDNAPRFRAEPQFVLRTSEGSVYYDAALNVFFKDRIWMGGIYHKDGSVGISVGGALQERIIMNYSYDIGMGNSLARQSSGSHEISIGFLLKAKDKTRWGRGRSLFLLDPGVSGGGGGDDPRVPQILKDLKAATDTLTNYKKRTDDRIAKLEADVIDLKKRNDQKKDEETAADYEAPFIIQNIKFGYNNDRLFPSSYPELDKLARKMQDNAKLEIKITGYTDNIGAQSYNLRLSKRRAESVANYLISKGIAAAKIKTFGEGANSPIASNDTKEGQELNRRIEGAFKKIK